MKKRFHKVHVEITNVCNLQCSFCPPVIRDKKMMDLSLFRKVIEQVAPLTELVCLHLMGDPLVHPHFSDIVDICDEFEVNIFLVTNGVLMRDDTRENLFDTLLHKRFYQINFSLHSFFDNFPEKDPTNYLNRVFSFTKRALAERPELYLNYRLWNLNDPLSAYHTDANAIQNSQQSNAHMLTRICEHFDIEIPTTPDVRQRKSIRIRDRLYLHFDTEFVWPSLDLPVLGEQGSCYGLSSHFGVLADGSIVPCCLDKEAAIPLGNVHEQKIIDVLGARKAQDIIKGFKQKQLIEPLCQRCQYIERFAKKDLPLGND
ncbi:MAG: radical SAM/SPASM domain-containing protein [Arenicella sp.]